MSESIAIIINPHARQAKDCIAKIEEKTEENSIPVTFFHVLGTEKLEEILDKALQSNPTHMVVGGGDGTIRTAAEVLLGGDIPLIVLPLGTTNNIARSLDIPLNWEEALDLVTTGTAKEVYAGEVNGRIFCNAATLGISSRIPEEVTHKEKQFLGRFAYAVTGLRLFIKHSPFRCSIKSPTDSIECKTYQVVISNGGLHAGREISDTSVEERRLSLTIFGKYQARWSAVKSFLSFLLGKHREDTDTILKHDRSFEVHTKPSQSIELDGELLAETPATFTISPKKLLVMAPRKEAASSR